MPPPPGSDLAAHCARPPATGRPAGAMFPFRSRRPRHDRRRRSRVPEAARGRAAPGSTWPAASSGSRASRWTTAGTSRRSSPRADRGRDRAPALDHRPQPEPGHSLRPLDQPLPRLRARLHLLLRPADAFLPRPLARARLRDPADGQARRARRCWRPSLPQRGYRPEPIAIGTNTDPYQPIEKRFGIMRGILGVLSDFGHPVTILTKSALIERDADILGAMGAGRAGRRRALGDDARPQARPGDGAAGGRAGAAAARDPPAGRRRLPDAGLDRRR